MEMVLIMIAAAALIGVLSYKWGTFAGYDEACEDFLEELKEVEEYHEYLRRKK